MSVDLVSLERLLSNVGWTIPKMERATGIKINDGLSHSEKMLIWKILKDDEVRRVYQIVKYSFPDAVITSVSE